MQPTRATAGAEAQIGVNEELWTHADLVDQYTGRTLRAVEVMLLVRYREAFSARVLELGCGAGRLSGYLVALARDFHGVDISPRMIEHCRAEYPAGTFQQRDLRELAGYGGSFDVVFASYNVLDVLDDPARRRVLGDIRDILEDDGLLIFSSHNLAHAPFIPSPRKLRGADLPRRLFDLRRLPRRMRNHRRVRDLQARGADHAVLVDDAHDYSILHYYVGRDQQERQLRELGFELLEVLDLDARRLAAGEQAAYCPELHYVARRANAA